MATKHESGKQMFIRQIAMRMPDESQPQGDTDLGQKVTNHLNRQGDPGERLPDRRDNMRRIDRSDVETSERNEAARPPAGAMRRHGSIQRHIAEG
jgi:hypothetical protein